MSSIAMSGIASRWAIRVAMVTNIPAPYRVPVLNRLAAIDGVTLKAFYCAEREPDRQWDLPEFRHDHEFLRGRMHTRNGRYIHDNPEIYDRLKRFAPDVVVTTGYNPTHLYAFAYALANRKRHVAMTDGSLESEAGLSSLHRAVRRFVISRSAAFVVASNGGRRLFESYGVAADRIHFSPLCANTEIDWAGAKASHGKIDLLFSGRLVTIKNCDFFLDVASMVAKRLGRRVRVAVLGNGPLEGVLRAKAQQIEAHVEAIFAGYVGQAELPGWFSSARLFLFPTSWDPWGVVANEAGLVGVPVLVTPHAGVAGELVRDGINGRVLPLNREVWACAATELLTSDLDWERMSEAARQAVRPYNFDEAAHGIFEASKASVASRVVCVQRRLTHYRVPFFERVKQRLAQVGIRFELVIGDGTQDEVAKGDEGTIGWAKRAPCTYFFGGRLCWQNCWSVARGADLLILTQENKLVYNYLAVSVARPKRLAFWGHGRNFQNAENRTWVETLRRKISRRADWWFTYSALSSRVVEGFGFPASRIMNLENSIDTSELVAMCDAVSEKDIQNFRAQWQTGDGPVAMYIGSLYAEKRIDFLLAAAARVAHEVEGFRLVVIGDGPERGKISTAAAQSDWLLYGGVKFGKEKAVCLRAAALLLNPGLVGLGILDSFSAGIPLVTTDCGLHSPEIDYLRSGENGLMTSDSVDDYAAAVVRLLRNESERMRLSRGARMAASHYTLENMVDHLCDGVQQALARRPR